jgi:Tol biopolymer transport system component
MSVVADARDPAVSPDGTRLAFARPGATGDLRIAVAPLADLRQVRLVTGDGDGLWDHRHPAWSPDGKTLCYEGRRDLWLVPVDDGRPRRLTTDDEVDIEPVWAPDGRNIYFSSYREGTSALWRVAAAGGKPQRLTQGGGPERHPTLSLDGRRLAYATFQENPDVVIHELSTGKESVLPRMRDEMTPALSRDGGTVVFVSNRLAGRSNLWAQGLSGGLPAGQPRRLTEHLGTASRPALSPDGRWIAYHRTVAGQRDVWIVSITGGAPVRFTEDPAADIHPDWSPDGSLLAFASERGGGSHIWVAPVAEGRPAGAARALTQGPRTDLAPAWSPDGRTVAFVSQEGGGRTEVWLVPADGSGPPQQVTHGADAGRVRWRAATGALLASGWWGDIAISLRNVDVRSGATLPVDPPVRLGQNPNLIDFDVSFDGRLVAFSREAPQGDVWILEAQERSY